MRPWIAVTAMTLWGIGASAELTVDRVQADMEAVTALSMNSHVWGLSAPQERVTVTAIEDIASGGHPMLPLLPDHARFEQGALVFSLGEHRSVVGAWNCGGRLPAGSRIQFPDLFHVTVEFEQSMPGETVWTVTPWADGTRTPVGRRIAREKRNAEARKEDVAAYLERRVYRYCRRSAKGPGRHTLTFETPGVLRRGGADTSLFDGVEFSIQGPEGAEIRLHRIEIWHKTRRGGFRREFDLPAGRLWTAVGNVKRKTILFVNGEEVPSSTLLMMRPHPNHKHGEQLQEVDLAPYLKPGGKNTLAVYPAYPIRADAFLDARVVMESGEMLDLSTTPDWRYVPQRVDGWNRTGFKGDTAPITQTLDDSASSLPEGLAAIRYGFRIYMREKHRMSAYAGRVRLRSPSDNQLYLSSDRPFLLVADVPAGLAAVQPRLEWMVCRVAEGEALSAALSGTAHDPEQRKLSLRFELRADGQPLAAGVYLVKVVLHAHDGTVLEDRVPEPFVVTARLDMPRTEGESFEDDLHLEPEQMIDFTRPDDPAFEWMETDTKQLVDEPKVVEHNGLTYRETRGTSIQSLISYNITFEHPGDFYVMTLEYPDDRPRFFGVNLASEHDGDGDHSKAGPSVFTGIWHPNTGKMQTLKWLFRPDPGFTSVNLINMLPTSTAAASKLTLQHVRGVLPELSTRGSERRLGILTESARSYSGFGKTFRSTADPTGAHETFYQMPGSWGQNVQTASVLKMRLRGLRQWLDTCNHYAEYLRWSGQNVIFLAFFQYDGSNPNAEPLSATRDARVVPHITDLATRVFRENGIDFFSSVEYCSDPALQTKYAETADLSQSPFLIDRHGKEARVWRTNFNFNHPDVRESMFAVAEEAVKKFRMLPNFKGVNFTTSFSSPLMAPNYYSVDYSSIFQDQPIDPLDTDYSDATVRKFEKDTGIDVGVPEGSPARFPVRHKLLTSGAMRETWIEWRARNTLDFFLDLRDHLRTVKPDVKVTTGAISAGTFFDYMDQEGISGERAMRELGWDFSKFHGHEGVYTMPWLQGSGRYGFQGLYAGRHGHYREYLRRLRANSVPAHLKIGDGDVERMAMIDYGWRELEALGQKVLPKREHWQVPYQYTMEGQPQGDNALRPFVLAMAATDADTLLYGFTDVNLKIGSEQPLREFARFLRSLPKAKFSRYEGGDRELVVRVLARENDTLFYALNPAPWPVDVEFRLQGTQHVRELIADRRLNLPVRVRLDAYHGASFAAEGAGARIRGWSTRGATGTFALYRDVLRDSFRESRARLRDVRIASALLPEQKKTMVDLVEKAGAALDGERYAEAWNVLRSWEFIWGDYFLDRQSEALELMTEQARPAPILKKRTIRAVRTVRCPKVDGLPDDKVWQEAEPAEHFVEKDGRASGLGTSVRLLWDTDRLYLAFVCRDNFPEQLRAVAEERDDIFGSGDDAVVFLLQPDLERGLHYQFAFNTAGVRFDQRNRVYAYDPEWQVAVRVNEQGWTAEATLPFEALEAAPEPGTRWGGNFCRMFRRNRLPWSTWTHMPGSWHRPEFYGTLVFESRFE